MYRYASVKNILINGLDSEASLPSNKESALKPPQSAPRFAINPKDYKSIPWNSFKESNFLFENSLKKPRTDTYEEHLRKRHPFSKYGNASWDTMTMLELDKADEELKKQGVKTVREELQEDYDRYNARENAKKTGGN